MLPQHVALVSQTTSISASELSNVAAALQKQVTRDFSPLWTTQATVDAFHTLQDVPLGYWPVIVRDDINTPGAAGVHEDKNKQPFALVQYSNSWSLTASHETLEMLADPFGNRVMSGGSIKPDQGLVSYLVEVCDPCEDPSFSYTVNGVMMSDFYTPHFFDPVTASGVRYDYTGAITQPRQLLKGGYISWHDPVGNHWWQAVYFGDQIEYRDLGELGQLTGSLRETIDSLTPNPMLSGVDAGESQLVAAQERAATGRESTHARAAQWEEQIRAIVEQQGK